MTGSKFEDKEYFLFGCPVVVDCLLVDCPLSKMYLPLSVTW